MDRPDLREEVEALRERVAYLEARLQARPEHDADRPGISDHRDRSVVAALDEGQVVGAKQLRALYRRETDVRANATLRNRVKDLVTDGPFERVDGRRWRYTGGSE